MICSILIVFAVHQNTSRYLHPQWELLWSLWSNRNDWLQLNDKETATAEARLMVKAIFIPHRIMIMKGNRLEFNESIWGWAASTALTPPSFHPRWCPLNFGPFKDNHIWAFYSASIGFNKIFVKSKPSVNSLSEQSLPLLIGILSL